MFYIYFGPKPQSMRALLLSLFVLLSLSVFAQDISTRYELVNMGKKVNTFHHEAAPIVSPDGNTLYFFVQNHPENTYGKEDSQDIWMTKKDDKGEWETPQHLGSPFNDSRSNQVFTVLPDGKLFIKGGRGKNEKGFSIVTGSRSLTELDVQDFKKMNKGRFYGASMSADQKHIIIYFSEVEGAINSDLYASHLQPNGSWTRPVKLKLSTNLDDVGPFIGPDQKTLYFGSARQSAGRQGGVDIYKSTRLDETWTNWSEPINMGKPINTGALDLYFTIDNAGNVFTSRANKALEGAQLDLYTLVPKTFKIDLVGTVYNEKTQQPMSAAVELKIQDKEPIKLTANAGKFETKISEVKQITISASASEFLPKTQNFKIPVVNSDTTISVEISLMPVSKKLMLIGNVYDKKTEKLINSKVTAALKGDKKTNFKLEAANGKFEQEITKLGWYVLTGSAEGYINATDSIWINAEDVTPLSKDLYLQPIEVGLTVRLKNIYFDFDKTTLKSQSFAELNKVVDFLKQNQTVEIEISGHTDSKGSDDYNNNLSQGRSQSVVDYLITQGIDTERLTAHGYGESKPVDTNDSEEGRANNRRVEFTIVKK
jgi:OmpA-OmpF porin, OOP family